MNEVSSDRIVCSSLSYICPVVSPCRYDEWIDQERIVGKSSSPSKGGMRPAYGKKQPPGKKPRGRKSLTPSGPPGSSKPKEADISFHNLSPIPSTINLPSPDVKIPAKSLAGTFAVMIVFEQIT